MKKKILKSEKDKKQKEKEEMLNELKSCITDEVDEKLDEVIMGMGKPNFQGRFPKIKKLHFYLTFKNRVSLHKIVLFFIAINYVLEILFDVSLLNKKILNLIMIIFAG